MKKLLLTLMILLPFATNLYADEPRGKIGFTEPKDGASVKNPVKFCFSEEALKPVKSSKNNVDGEGHHHLLVDTRFPKNLSYAGGKNPTRMIHLNDGSTCFTLKNLYPPGNIQFVECLHKITINPMTHL